MDSDQQPYQPPQQSVQPASNYPSPPPPQRKDINWLVVVLIACGAMLLVPLAVLVVITIYATVIWNQAKESPVVQSAERLAPAVEEMADMTRAQIEEVAAYVPAEELGRDPDAFNDRYIMTDGTVSKRDSISLEQKIALDIYRDDENYKGYVLDDAVVVVDTSGEGPEVAEGATVMAYGVLFVLRIEDVWELPVIGPQLKQEYGEVEGMSETVVFLIATDTEIMALSSNAESTGKDPS